MNECGPTRMLTVNDSLVSHSLAFPNVACSFEDISVKVAGLYEPEISVSTPIKHQNQ